MAPATICGGDSGLNVEVDWEVLLVEDVEPDTGVVGVELGPVLTVVQAAIRTSASILGLKRQIVSFPIDPKVTPSQGRGTAV